MKKAPLSKRNQLYSPQNGLDLIRRYEDGEGIASLAKEEKVTRPTMSKFLKRNGVVVKHKSKNPASMANLEKGRWQKGQVTNPKGRPKGSSSLTEQWKKMLTGSLNEVLTKEQIEKISAKHGKGYLDKPIAKLLVTTAVLQALSGDFQFFNMLWQRSDGKVADRVAGHDGGPVVGIDQTVIDKIFNNPESMEAMIKVANKVAEQGKEDE